MNQTLAIHQESSVFNAMPISIELKQIHASLNAANAVEEILDDTLERFISLNERLYELRLLIRTGQPKSSGAVCLELYECGKPGCTGCPHPRWLRYWWPEGEPDAKVRATNLSAKGKDPVLSLPRSPHWSKAVANLIREAKRIINERAALVSTIQRLRPFARRSTNT
jgi:hypothetical protein